MLADYLAFTGPADVAIGGPFQELVNSARAYAYADEAGIPWLDVCDHCPTAHPAGTYLTPGTGSVAPWYSAGNPDTARFLGVIGMDIEGGDSSTRQVTVSQSLSTGGAISAPYHGPRTLVLRGLAIASDDCGLQAGINWLQFTFADEGDPCLADSLVYYDCCPDSGSASAYRRQYREARITEGPEFLEMYHHMPSGIGACAVFELTFVAANPAEYAPSALLLTLDDDEPGDVIEDAA